MNKLLVVSLFLTVMASAKTAPSFQGQLLDGGRVTLKEKLKPGRALLLSFWASWCEPCMQELKEVTAHLKKDTQLPLDVLTVNVDTSETSSDVKPTIKLQGFQFPVIADPKHEIFSKYQQTKSLPFSVLITANGSIAKTFNGYNEAMFQEIEQVLGAEKKPHAN